MIGAIIGDIVGSPYEGKSMGFFDWNFPLFNEKSTFTDDTILTIATAKAILEKSGSKDTPYKEFYLHYGKKYPRKGYGRAFSKWLNSDDPQPYNSYGNGSAMRVSPVGLFYDDYNSVSLEAGKSSEVTHNHPEAMNGAECIAVIIHYAKVGIDRKELKELAEKAYDYEFPNCCEFYRDNYKFTNKCKDTVVMALTAFFESEDFESCIRNAVLMGGDADTTACIAGALAEAYYKKIPKNIAFSALSLIPIEFSAIIRDFYKKLK